MFSIKFGDYSHKTVDIDGVFRNYYDEWFNSHVGQWTKEKNIKLLQGECIVTGKQIGRAHV